MLLCAVRCGVLSSSAFIFCSEQATSVGLLLASCALLLSHSLPRGPHSRSCFSMTSSANVEVASTPVPEVVSDSGNSSATDERSMLVRFALEYGRYHGYISVVVCLLGIVCSLLVIAVLTRRHMLTSSNYMLTALAICDLITMLSYIPYAIQFYCLCISSSRTPTLSYTICRLSFTVRAFSQAFLDFFNTRRR